MGYSDLETGELSFMDKVRTNWNGFRKFMWNPEERTVMGRGGKSWAKISLFYCIYYTFLAGFWAAMLAVFLQTVSYDRPKFTALISTPALHSIPKPDDQDRIRWTPGDQDSVDRITAPIQALYNELNPDDMTGLEDCTNVSVGSVDDGQRFCKFDLESLGPCNSPPNFGWDTMKPCVFLRFNRVFNWTPENYESAADVPERIRDVYQDNNVAINCFGRRESDRENLNFTMPFPNAGIPFGFFPYVLGAYNGEDKQRLIQPVVAIQLSLNAPNEAVQIECQAYTGNIRPRTGLFDTDDESRVRIYVTARKSES